MSEPSMTGRPYGGVNERPEDAENLPGERPLPPDEREQRRDPDQSPRAAEEPMPTEEQREGVAGSGTSPNSSGPPDAGTPRE